MDSLLERSLKQAPVIRRGKYRYFIHPLTDSIPPIDADLMKHTCERIVKAADLDADCIVTLEAMGIHISAVVSQMSSVPVNIVRKRPYSLPGEEVLDQRTGYGGAKMYLNSVQEGDRVCVVDAVVSTGGTLVALIDALRRRGAEITDIVCVIGRGDGAQRVFDETGLKVKTLVDLEVKEDVEVVSSNY